MSSMGSMFMTVIATFQVKAMFKQMAEDAQKVMDAKLSGIEKITSGDRNLPGVHLAVIPNLPGLL